MHVEGNDVLRKLLTSEFLKLWLSNLLRGSEMFKWCRLCNKSNERPYLLFFITSVVYHYVQMNIVTKTSLHNNW